MSTPAAFRGASIQEVGTPIEFINAVENRFGSIVHDLAANASNRIAIPWYGPGSPYGENALAIYWPSCSQDQLLWLNPPYNMTALFVQKCAEEMRRGCNRIAVLIPASISTNYFAEFIHPFADVYPLRPRMVFVGHSDPYPKDLMLCVFEPRQRPRAFSPWRWTDAKGG